MTVPETCIIPEFESECEALVYALYSISDATLCVPFLTRQMKPKLRQLLSEAIAILEARLKEQECELDAGRLRQTSRRN